jgi:DNA repair protein RadD
MKLGKIELRPFQNSAHDATIEYIRQEFKRFKEEHLAPRPGFVYASVGAGKSLMIGAVAEHVQKITGWKCMVMARQAEIIEQNSEMGWLMDVKNSIYSASLKRKSTHYPVVMGQEKTVANALDQRFTEWVPDVLLIDECHQLSWQDCMSEKAETVFGKIIQHFYKLNPRLMIIGYTGSPYRGTESILGDFWHKMVYKIETEELVELGFLVPTIFGWPEDDERYDLDKFSNFEAAGTDDFSQKELDEMAEILTKDPTLTQKIMRHVMELTKGRNGVLITCANKSHCQQAAAVLPEGSYAIITDDTTFDDRMHALKSAKSGKLKYMLQIGCLTTGVNVPYWDTSVILRRIHSLTLLIQLLGRGMRLLDDVLKEQGIMKPDHLVLDYSGTMDAMGSLYSDPILERASLSKAKKEKKDLKYCPACGAENSPGARRCIGVNDGKRCEFFFVSKVCKSCGTQNDPTAQTCRNPDCGKELIDPNEKLYGKHYTDKDWKTCTGFDLEPCKNGGIMAVYRFIDDGKEQAARLFFSINSEPARKILKMNLLARHIKDWSIIGRIMNMKSAEDICHMKKFFAVPTSITHRKNLKGRDVINGVNL